MSTVAKKEKLLLAKKEKKVKVQKANECFNEGQEKYHKAVEKEKKVGLKATKDDYEEALESLTIAISLRANNPKYYYARANCFRAYGDFQRAFFDYSAAIRWDEKPKAAYYKDRGMCLRRLGQIQEAVTDYTTAIKLEADKQKIGNHYFNRALIYFETDRMDEAIRDYTTAMHVQGDSKTRYKGFFNRGNCYRKMGRLDDSIEDLQAAVELDSGRPDGQNSLGLSYFEVGQYEDAAKSFTEAVSLDKTNSTYVNNRGLCYYHMGRSNLPMQDLVTFCLMSLDDFKEAIALSPDEANYYFNRGNALLGLNIHQLTVPAAGDGKDGGAGGGGGGAATGAEASKAKEAAKKAKAAADAGMGPPPPAATIGGVTIDAKDAWMTDPDQLNEASLADLIQAVALDAPQTVKSARYVHSVGLAYQQMGGRAADALAQFQGAVRLDPQHMPSLYHAGLMLHKLQRHEEALSALGAVLDKVVNDYLVYESRGLVLQTMGEHQRAVEDFTMALVLLKDGAAEQRLNAGEDHYYRGKSLLALGRHEEALDDLDCALQIGYTDSAVHHARAMAKQAQNHLADALLDFTEALQQEPLNPKFLYDRGQCYRSVGKPEQAETDLTLALQKRKEVLAQVEAEGGDARAHQAAMGGIGELRLLFGAGLASYEQDKFPVAIAHLQAALDVWDGEAAAAADAAALAEQAAWGAEDEDADMGMFSDLPRGGGARGARSLRGESGAGGGAGGGGKGRPSPAGNQEEEGRGDASSSVPGRRRSSMMRASAVSAAAVARTNTSAGLSPGLLCDIHYHLGLAHANSPPDGEHAQAIHAFSRAAGSAVDEVTKMRCVHERAKSRQMEQKYHEAIEDFTSVITHNPRNAHAFFRRGFAWKSLNDFEKAADDLETAKALDPDNPFLVVNYSQLHLTECVVLCLAGDEKEFP
jgi:tetratricopeptide (TPR) repeat protein